jgi:hypothetical protein
MMETEEKEITTEEEEVVETDETEETETEETETEETETEETEEKPDWLKDLGEMPVSSHLKTKKKLQGRIEEKDTELARLKEEIERLKSLDLPSSSVPTLKRPRASDFDTDEEYEAALDNYDEANRKTILESVNKVNTQKIQEDQFERKVKKALNDHDDRARSFIEEQHIDPETFITADGNVRQAIETIRPQQGNQLADFLITQIGEDSEKVMLALGSNKDRLAEFQATLLDDPNGIKTAVFLGELKQRRKGLTLPEKLATTSWLLI